MKIEKRKRVYDIYPTRSQFYNITPIGVGKENIESLTSYIGRIAEAHSIRVSAFVNKFIKPHKEGGKCEIFGLYSSQINGVSSHINKIVNIMEELTSVTNLSELTLIKFKDIISNVKLMKRYKAWCSRCFQEMKEGDIPIYEKLIWNINNVNCCNIHKVDLIEKCPNCNSYQKMLDPNMINGFCTKCRVWLGSNELNNSTVISSCEELIISKMVGKLIKESGKTLDGLNLARSLLHIKEHLFPIPKQKFCKQTLKMNYNTYNNYITNSTKPEISNIIKISFYFNISLLDLFDYNIKKIRISSLEEKRNLPSNLKPRFDANRAKEGIVKILKDEDIFPISLVKVASILGYSYPTIKQYFPEYCNQIKEKNEIRKKLMSNEKREERVRRIKNCILEIVKEDKYPSIRLIQSRIGNSFGTYNAEDLQIWRNYLKELNINIRK